MQTHEIKKIKLPREGVIEFSNYLVHVAHQRIELQNPILGNFIKYHYEKISEKVGAKAFQGLFKRTKQISISLSYPEVKTLSVIFKYVPPEGYVLVIQNQVLEGLTLD